MRQVIRRCARHAERIYDSGLIPVHSGNPEPGRVAASIVRRNIVQLTVDLQPNAISIAEKYPERTGTCDVGFCVLFTESEVNPIFLNIIDFDPGILRKLKTQCDSWCR